MLLPLHKLGLVLCLPLLLPCAGAARAQPYSPATHRLELTDLGAGVNPQAINDVGQVTGQSAGQAFLWSGGVLTPLGTLGGAEGFGNDLNDAGVVVGWSHDANGVQKAFKWQAGVMTNLDSVTSLASSAEAINKHDVIVGWKTNGSIFRSCIWSEPDPTGFLAFGLGNHKALGINDQGKIVGVTLDANNNLDEGFYHNGTDSFSSFSGLLGESYLPVAGVNNIGLTAGNRGTGAFTLAIGENNPLPIGKILAEDLFSIALGLNDTGLVVGESGEKGFAYDLTTGTLHDLNHFASQGFKADSILRLTDVNNHHVFIGVALVGGVEHGFVGQFVAVPEPSTLALGTLAAILLAGIIARRRRQ